MIDAIQAVYTDWFTDELLELPPDQQARVVKRIVILERKGWSISARDDDIKELKEGIWELRIVGKGPAYRVLFFPMHGDPKRFVVLTNCVKKGLLKKTKVKDAEIQRALARRTDWLKDKGLTL
jgi:phage-related protein